MHELIDFSTADLPVRDGAATAHCPRFHHETMNTKRDFASMIQRDFPQHFDEIIIRTSIHHSVYTIDILAFTKLLRKYKAFPEGYKKNTLLLQWANDNKDYLEFMLL